LCINTAHMLDLSEVRLQKLSVHIVGNKGTGGELITSKKPFRLEEHNAKTIATAFTAKLSQKQEWYRFTHLSSLDYNEVYNYCLQALAEDKDFHKQGVAIAKHLYEASTHPKIKAGELYICYFDNCLVNGAYIPAIGIYKIESKTQFINVDASTGELQLAMQEGTEVSKYDKAALIFASNAEEGFDLLIQDTNRGEEAVFWRETFLGIAPQADEYHNTKEFLGMAKNFITKQIPQEYDMERTDQIDLLNKSVEYFQINESFDRSQFEKQVLKDGGLIKSFRNFGESYAETNDLELPDRFDISEPAVKRQQRVFKSVLKLDKNFHVYIHGDSSLIEKGYDSHLNKSYYKIYFDEEN
jgi:hypothetical protein